VFYGLFPDGRIILKWIFEKSDGSMDRIYLAEFRYRWQGIVNAVIELRFPQDAGNFLTS
jgi:hypothetical protein